MGESANDSRDTVSSSEEASEVPCLYSQSVPGKPEDPASEPVPPEPVRQGSGTLAPTVPATMTSLAATTTTITTGVLMECALAVLFTRLGQQSEERAKDRCCIKELFQHLNETSYQFAYIRKVLDHLVSCQTLAVVTAASNTTSGPAPSSNSGCLPLGQAASLPQPSTASGSVNPSISSNHIGGHVALASCTSFLQASWDLQDHAQTLAFQCHANDTPMTYSPQSLIPSDPLPQCSSGMGAPTMGQPLNFHQQQQPQAAITTGLPGAPQHSTIVV